MSRGRVGGKEVVERTDIKQSAHGTAVKTLALTLAQTGTTLREGFQRVT